MASKLWGYLHIFLVSKDVRTECSSLHPCNANQGQCSVTADCKRNLICGQCQEQDPTSVSRCCIEPGYYHSCNVQGTAENEDCFFVGYFSSFSALIFISAPLSTIELHCNLTNIKTLQSRQRGLNSLVLSGLGYILSFNNIYTPLIPSEISRENARA